MNTIRAFLSSRPVKDFVIDFLTGIPAGYAAIALSGWDDVRANAAVLSFAVAKAFVQAITRAALKWASAGA